MTSIRNRSTALRRSLLLLTAFAFAIAGPSFAQAPCPSAPERSAAVPTEFTGEFDRGTPVYRLPSISVLASRRLAVVEAQPRRRDATVQRVPAQPARGRSAS
jgi:hypothetical protein